MNSRVLRYSPFFLLLLCISSAFAAEVQVERLSPVASPDDSRSVVIDRVFRVIDGEADRFSGRLVIRIVDSGSTESRQRVVEASQIRTIQPPVWLSDDIVAVSYNVAKNSNGMAYMDADTGEAVQVELVATSRRMGATGRIETELTSFDVIAYSTSTIRLSSVPHNGCPVFPLFLKEVPPQTGDPFPLSFLAVLQKSIAAYDEFCEKHGVTSVRVEAASESFNEKDDTMALLACMEGRATLVIVPLDAQDANSALMAAVVGDLGNEIQLDCAAEPLRAEQATESTSEEAPAQEDGMPGDFEGHRYTTRWKDDGTVLVEKEMFADDEEEEPIRQPLYAVNRKGEVKKLSAEEAAANTKPAEPRPAGKPKETERPTATPKATPTVKPSATEKPSATAKPTATTKPSATARSANTQKAAATKTQAALKTSPAVQRTRTASTPAVTASPSPTEKPGLLRRLIPGRRGAKEEAPPARTE